MVQSLLVKIFFLAVSGQQIILDSQILRVTEHAKQVFICHIWVVHVAEVGVMKESSRASSPYVRLKGVACKDL